MSKPALQRYRVLAQIGFFALFTLTPIFDLFRYDLTERHAYFLTIPWHLGIDDLIAGRVAAGAEVLGVAGRSGAAVVQRIGHTAVLYRGATDKRRIVLPRA